MAYKGRTYDDTEKMLQRLRKKKSTFNKSIENQFLLITDEMLYDPDAKEIYSERLEHQRDLNGLTFEQIGFTFGISHTNVRKKEYVGKKIDKKINKKIDKRYLEAFSLLYHVSPLYLIGKKDDPRYVTDEKGNELTLPMLFPEPLVEYKAKLILHTLYNTDSDYEVNQNFLGVLAKLCTSKFYWSEIIENWLLTAPKIEKLMKNKKINSRVNPEKLVNGSEDSRSSFGLLGGNEWLEFIHSHQRASSTITSCSLLLNDLYILNSEMFDLIAHIALANAEIKEFVCNALEKGSFLDAPRSFSKNVNIKKFQKSGDVEISLSNVSITPVSSDMRYDMGYIVTSPSKKKEPTKDAEEKL